MTTGWTYRLLAVTGVVGFVILSVLVANSLPLQQLFTTYIPLFNRLEPTVLFGQDLRNAVLLSVLFSIVILYPIYRPRPRRILNITFLTQKRVGVVGLALATVGYFEWSHRLPRTTLVMMTAFLALALPVWFVVIRRPNMGSDQRTILVGDDLDQMRASQQGDSVLGYLCPPTALPMETPEKAMFDGGTSGVDGLEYLGGLSRLEDMLVQHDVDTVVLAFSQPDRAEFFGALDACFEHGVDAKVHKQYADSVLIANDAVGELVDIEIEPWDPLDYLVKRTFDVAVAATALLTLAPITILIMIAIWVEDEGPIFFEQKRTYLYGETFKIRKFRTLRETEGGEVGVYIDEDRHTLLGKFLRTTHLDEIPQLWSILVGDMSVVGPRPAQTELEPEFENETVQWRRRWFVKPGLTGLAQINDATSQEPAEKLQYDLQYIRDQSLLLDLKILVRQLWKVGVELLQSSYR